MAKVSTRRLPPRKPRGGKSAGTKSAGTKSAGTRSARSKSAEGKRGARKARFWSARVTHESDALDLERGVFTGRDPETIAASLKRSAQRSRRRKSDPYRSALSMLTFYINRAGKNFSAAKRKRLQRAKLELRKQFGRA